jgi:hypothetical protein
MSDKTFPVAAGAMPEGEYAIVEILGHRTLVGRVTEVDRFSCKMLQIEPLFADLMLGPVLIGGSSIYQFTPCTAEIAFARRPKGHYALPASVLATVPAKALPNNSELPSFLAEIDKGDAPDHQSAGGW